MEIDWRPCEDDDGSFVTEPMTIEFEGRTFDVGRVKLEKVEHDKPGIFKRLWAFLTRKVVTIEVTYHFTALDDATEKGNQ